ncbi:MAG: hypothetical protein U0Q10_13385 [Dermatophilaceae bacterium]
MPITDREYRAQFFRNADVQQGLAAALHDLYVPIYNDPHLAPFDLVPKMRDVIDFKIGQSVQLLSGFRGCGKTSELLRLSEELQADGYAVAYLDINAFLNTCLPLDARPACCPRRRVRSRRSKITSRCRSMKRCGPFCSGCISTSRFETPEVEAWRFRWCLPRSATM